MSKFPWGQVIDRLEIDFDGEKFEVTKYYPSKFVNGHHVLGEYEKTPHYHNEELRESNDNIYALTISMIARRHLGTNQHALVAGIVRALCICDEVPA